ncbi:retrovirus-related pol polyprotein from transposon TNT 1-94 [Tanacetum coccineum]
MIDSQMDDMIREKLALKEQIDSLEQNLSKQIKEKESLFKTFLVFKNESKEKENKYMENEIDLEKKIKELDNIICKVGQSAQTVHMLTKPQAFYDNTHKQALELSTEQVFWFHILNLSIESSFTPPVIVEVLSELPKVSLVNASLKKLKFHLTQFDSVVKKRTTPNALEEGEWGFKHTKTVFNNEIIPFLKSLKDIFNLFDKDLLNEIKEVQTVFDQIDAAVQQSSVDKQCLEIAKKEILLENDRLLQKITSQDVMLTVMNSMSLNNDSVNMEMQEYKDKTICKLKATIKSLRENTKEENVNPDKCDLEPINKEQENSVAKLLYENERHCNEINHVKQVFKDQFDSIKQTRVRHKEQSDSLINKLNLKSVENEDLKSQIQDKVFVITSLKNDLRKLKGKEIVENAVHTPSATTIAPGMFKLDLEPLPPRLLQNREVHIDYLRNTQEQDNILSKPLPTQKAKQPLDSELDFAVESSNTSDSNTPVLSSTGVKCSTSNCGSKPPGNKKNDRISQTPSRNKKNKVEAQPRKVNKMNRVVKPVCDVDVKHSLSNANSEILCATCNKSMFDGVHDKCLLDLVQNGNNRTKSAKKHKKQNIWKPTGHVFTEVGFKWKPTGRTFTIVGNSCPLTRLSRLFGNDQITRIIGYGDYQLGNIIISRVYYVEGLGHNLFSFGQFCDADLETISLDDMLKSSPICLLSKASKTKSWLWHHRLSHLNFGTLNKLAKDGLARGIPRLKFQKDQLCSACALGKSKKSYHQPKAEDTNQEKLYLLHMDLCG